MAARSTGSIFACRATTRRCFSTCSGGGVAMTDNALPPAARADHLTAVLRKSGALGDGRVRDVTVERSFDTVLSHIMRLRLHYEGGAAAAAPSSLIFKSVIAERADTFWF